ncbi:hypothetical protein Isop_1068 [Isosphaera pallida ATCC 43644]|uniref:Uncharacterized protein n=1 Tax=Isosphaera pallida (strain ATCC 43644 / DSM 9630 / IS1B) TaxID=575540 RepID=E8R469_ISOPI|nr:hypothetical protein Isop_1068 [Isosphaera pallida ATCC 43644]
MIRFRLLVGSVMAFSKCSRLASHPTASPNSEWMPSHVSSHDARA